MMILFFIVSIPPAIGCLLSIIPTWKYALDDDLHKKIVNELNERRHANADSSEEVVVENLEVVEEDVSVENEE